MVEKVGAKRQRTDHNRRRHDRNKFRRTTNATQQRKDLGYGLKGILISCTPRHENHAFREAVIMLGKYCENDANKLPAGSFDGSEQSSQEEKEEKAPCEERNSGVQSPEQEMGSIDVTKALQAELKDIRDPKQKLFTRVDGGVNGSVFLRINRTDVDTEKVVQCALEDARASGSPNSRHCIRIMPIHTTCYSKPEDAAKAAVDIVKRRFPSIDAQGKPVTYAISFKARLNTNAHRDAYITEIAKAIEEYEPRYKVNLTAPDVTLIVEILKTSCCIGTFRHFYRLAKMNLREAASGSKPKEKKENPVSEERTGDEEKQRVTAAVSSGSGIVAQKVEEMDKGDNTAGTHVRPGSSEGIGGGQDQKDDPAHRSEVHMAKVDTDEAKTVHTRSKDADGDNGVGEVPQQTSDARDSKAENEERVAE